jgi:hypothetical protein
MEISPQEVVIPRTSPSLKMTSAQADSVDSDPVQAGISCCVLA